MEPTPESSALPPGAQPVQMARSFDLALVKANAQRAREDAEMIVSLSSALENQVQENAALKAKLAALTPAAPAPPQDGKAPT